MRAPAMMLLISCGSTLKTKEYRLCKPFWAPLVAILDFWGSHRRNNWIKKLICESFWLCRQWGVVGSVTLWAMNSAPFAAKLVLVNVTLYMKNITFTIENVFSKWTYNFSMYWMGLLKYLWNLKYRYESSEWGASSIIRNISKSWIFFYLCLP